MNGTINANGAYQIVGGSGGSIWVTAGQIKGSGTICANAGAGTSDTGAGGRIALYQTVAEDWAECAALKVTASGWSGGTIYREDASGLRRLETGACGNANGTIQVPGDDQSETSELLFDEVAVTNGGRLQVRAGMTLKVQRKLDARGGAVVSDVGSTVELVGADDCVLCGNLAFDSLVCKVPGKTLFCGTGGDDVIAINPAGNLTLTTSADEDRVYLLPDAEGETWSLAMGTGALTEISNVAVSNSVASGALVVANDSVDLGGNESWKFQKAIPKGEVIIWTGAADTNWLNEANWDRERTPIATDVVRIPASCPNDPIITAEALKVSVDTLTVEADAELTLVDATLIVTKDFVCAGSLAFSGAAELDFAGDVDQTARLGGKTYAKVVVQKAGGTLSFLEPFAAGSFTCAASAPVALKFGADCTYAFERIRIDGYKEGADGAQHLISLGSTEEDQPWNLAVSRDYFISGTVVSDCHATRERIYAGDLSTDGEGNDNWDFSAGALAQWIGGSSSDFRTAANWRPQKVPGANTHVYIVPPSGTLEMSIGSSSLSIASLVLGGGDGLVTLNANKAVLIGDTMEVRSNAKYMLYYDGSPTVVSNNVIVRSGGVITQAQEKNTDYTIHLQSLGDMTVDAGGLVDSCGRSKNGGEAYGYLIGPGHGGIGWKNESQRCYGSAIRPSTAGSQAQHSLGGGIIRLEVSGTLTVNGSVDANGGMTSGGSGSGGSVWITAGTLAGTGTITASSKDSVAAGGRIALYQTNATDWAECAELKVLASGWSGGTIFRSDASGLQTLETGASLNAGGTVDFPALDPADDLKRALAEVKVSVGENTCLAVTGKTWTAGNTVRVKDLDLTTATSTAKTLGSVIRVKDMTHHKGRGWGDTYANLVDEEGGGKIVWSPGFALIIK